MDTPANAALQMLDKGLSVIPCDPLTKRPSRAWKPYQTTLMDIHTAASMQWPGLAVVAGAVSGNIEVLDFDFKAKWFQAWTELVEAEAPGLIHKLLIQTTQSGGKHVVYRCPGMDLPGNLELAADMIQVDGPGDHDYLGKTLRGRQIGDKWHITPCMIETRSEGGYFLAAPTSGYQVQNGNSFLALSEITPHERNILIRAAKALNKHIRTTHDPQPRTNTGDRPGDDYNQRADIRPLLERHGWTQYRSQGDYDYWTRPGKKTGISASLINGQVFKVFTSNSPPFEPEQAYSKFSVYAHLEHDGDFEAAAKALRADGYGGVSAQAPAGTMAGSQWPDLIPIGTPDPDRIPLDMWPSVLRDYATGAATETETPPELPAMLALGVLSTVAQRFTDVEIRPGYIEPTNIYTAIALPPATRKSQEFKRATLPLVRWEADQRLSADGQKKAAESKLATYRERIKKLRARAAKAKDDQEAGELAEKIAEIETQEPIIPKAPRLFTSDVTTEHLATIMADNNESLGLLSSEGGIIETMAGRYNNNIPNIDLYLKAHAADFVRVDRGSKPPVIMDEPRLTMALAIQPDALQALSNKPAFKGRGLVGRILYVIPPSMLGTRTGSGRRISDFDYRRYSDLITAMADTTLAGAKPDKIYLSAQARDVWTAYWKEIEPDLADNGQYAHCTDWFGKAPGAAARIAALFHIAVHGSDALRNEVSAEHMTAAVATTKALGTHALKVYGQMGAMPGVELAKVLLEWIKRHGHREFAARDAYRNHRSRVMTADEVDQPLGVLVEHGYIRPIASKPGPGRPSKRYEVNPLIWG
jgi:hypothetical protein